MQSERRAPQGESRVLTGMGEGTAQVSTLLASENITGDNTQVFCLFLKKTKLLVTDL